MFTCWTERNYQPDKCLVTSFHRFHRWLSSIGYVYLYLLSHEFYAAIPGNQLFKIVLSNALSRLLDIPSRSDPAETCSTYEDYLDKT